MDVLIVGGGLAGLSCALGLHARGIPVRVFEAADRVGGRLKTDHDQGFQLDRGFQVLQTAYPAAQQMLDYQGLNLHAFRPGALIRFNGAFHRFVDPWRHPVEGVRGVLGPIGTLADKLRMARLRNRTVRLAMEEMERQPETSTRVALIDERFTPAVIERFFEPFLGGVFLERDLSTSSRKRDFVFQMFAEGDAALPARGMEAIPRHLAARLPDGAITVNAPVRAVDAAGIELESGVRINGRAVVIATDGPQASRWLPQLPDPGSRGVTCLYFAADRSPVGEPILILDGERSGPVNNLCVPSDVAATYAPEGAALVSATVLGLPDRDDRALEAEVRHQFTAWFGGQVKAWRHLRTYRIRHGLPVQDPRGLDTVCQPVRLGRGLYVCGDHRDWAAIQGALDSGQRAAQALAEDL